MVNKSGVIIHKTNHKKGKRHNCNTCRYIKNHPVTQNIALVSVFGPRYLGGERLSRTSIYMSEQFLQ